MIPATLEEKVRDLPESCPACDRAWDRMALVRAGVLTMSVIAKAIALARGRATMPYRPRRGDVCQICARSLS